MIDIHIKKTDRLSGPTNFNFYAQTAEPNDFVQAAITQATVLG